MSLTPLPIDPHLDRLVQRLHDAGSLVVVAPPGSGKTTRLPPALAARGRVLLVQPRRVAARSLARRVAHERGWRAGEEVGWHVRHERQFSARTRLLVVTEGILLARLRSDPLISDFDHVILDEFHERSLHSDLCLAMLREAASARDDLRLVVMSATMDAESVAGYLGAPVEDLPGKLHPVTISHVIGITPARAIEDRLALPGGHLLCFLPGMREMRAVADDLTRCGATVRLLHGTLPPHEQDRALMPGPERTVILSTNVAETSLTVEGVTDVMDTGLHKVLRYDAERAIDRLETERISRDSADQRAGRAGRTGPGRATRLWDAREELPAHREPEIRRLDLSEALLDIMVWGDDPARFPWFEPPPPDRLEAAMALLTRLGAVEGGRATPLAADLLRIAAPPRLARVLLAAGGSRLASRAVAILSEGDFLDLPSPPTTDCDLLLRVERFREAPPGVFRAAEQLEAQARDVLGGTDPDDEVSFRRALLAGYPDRVARRREAGSRRFLLSTGTGAAMGDRSGVRQAPLVVVLEVRGGRRGERSEALIESASAIEEDWLVPTGRGLEHWFDRAGSRVRARDVVRYDALVLREVPAAPDPDEALPHLVEGFLARLTEGTPSRTLLRLRLAGLEGDLAGWVRPWLAGRVDLTGQDLEAMLPPAVRRELDRLAPDRIRVPSGREHALVYEEGGTAYLEVKLQEVFGLRQVPRIGPTQQPVVFRLLGPHQRPVQTTIDLESFWREMYPQIRKELRGRYPRHPWPEDPMTAPPTHRTQRKPS